MITHQYVLLQENLLCLSAQETGSYSRRARQGWRKVHKPSVELVSASLWRQNTMSTAGALQNDLQQATGVNLSDQTIGNRLHEGGLNACHPVLTAIDLVLLIF